LPWARAVLSASGPRQLSPQEVRRRQFGPVVSGGLTRSVPLRNGGQLYLDHDIRRGRGLYYQLQRSIVVDRAARDIDIFEAKTVPSALGRYRQAG